MKSGFTTTRHKPKPITAEAISRALCDRVRANRKRRGWTLEQLAQASGVSRSMLCQIERHQVNPTLAVVIRISEAFGMSVSAMVEPPDGTPAIEVIRADDRTYHYRLDRLCRWRTLSPLHLEKDVEFHKVRLRPGGTLRSAPHFQGTREFLSVQKGVVRVSSDDEACELRRGDSASYPADVKHAIENVGETEAILYLVVAYM